MRLSRLLSPALLVAVSQGELPGARTLAYLSSVPSKPRVELYTSRNCRACCRFEKKFDQLKCEFPQIQFERHELHEDENISRFRDNDICSIPCVLFFLRDEEVNRLLAVKQNYPEIERVCKNVAGQIE